MNCNCVIAVFHKTPYGCKSVELMELAAEILPWIPVQFVVDAIVKMLIDEWKLWAQ